VVFSTGMCAVVTVQCFSILNVWELDCDDIAI
jgi:hypothetical protein